MPKSDLTNDGSESRFYCNFFCLIFQVLDIKANHLQSLQNNIRQLLRLEVLDVTDCDLDTFPEGLVYCSSLVSLHAAFNRY